jgi:hypothetical protein
VSSNAEYLRRNLIAAKAVGAHANTVATLKRVNQLAHPPRWLVKALEGIRDRAEPLAAELAAYRDLIKYDYSQSSGDADVAK